MMMKFPLIATLATALMMAGAGHAKTYDCTVTPDSNSDWISKTLVFNIDDTTGGIQVFDGIIETYKGAPIAAKLSVETAKRITITWETRRVRDDYANSASRFMFRASYYKDSGKMIISSRPGGWDNMFGGRGRCIVSRDSNWGATVGAAKDVPFMVRGKDRFFRAGEWIVIP